MMKEQPRSESATDWREWRRLRAWELKRAGWAQNKIAEALAVSEGAVSQWLKRGCTAGKAALLNQPAPGPTPRLSDDDLEELESLLEQGPQAHGFAGAVWTRKRVRHVIQQAFDVTYHVSHISKILDKIGWSRQKPQTRASQRDAAAIETWRGERWEELKKKAAQEGRTIVFLDEAAFYLLPSLVRTYAPRGQTPILEAPYSYDHLSAISAITPHGRLFTHLQETSITGPDVVRFVEHLLRHIEGKLLLIWDGLSAHRCQEVKQLRSDVGERLHIERLPAYAPELNPDEGIWHLLKNVELPNRVCHTLDTLRTAVRKAMERLRHKTDTIRACFALAGLPL
ncbi:MAG: IS630 family transposase [Chloroflexota bacterium]|nr:IS630 family transposase [Chloroflexota bacterium]